MTGSAWKLGLISTLQFLPMLLFSLPAGALTDRLPKRKLIMVTQTIFMIQAFVLSALVWMGHVQYWHVATLAVMLGLVNTLDLPARQSFIVEMVGKADLASAVAMNSAMFNGARIVGPAIAGLLIGRYGIAPAFLMNGISFLAVLAALSFMQAEGLPKGNRRALGHEIMEGLRYAWGQPIILLLLALTFSVGVFVINWNVLVPLLASQILHQDAAGYGGLMACMGAGALAAALWKTVENRNDLPLRSIVVPAVALCAAALAMFWVRHIALAGVGLFVLGFMMIACLTAANTKLQMATPDALRGRVMSLYTLCNAGTTPLGSTLMGAVTQRWGASVGFLTGGSLEMVAVGLLLTFWMVRGRKHI
jgi:MFS family permease